MDDTNDTQRMKKGNDATMTQEQQIIFQLLQRYVEICDKHQLRYFLMGGTLLGAVRHHGFIPWDDDIDVAMPVNDLIKFLKLENELPENIVIQSEDNDTKYPFIFVKLCDRSHPFLTKNSYGPKGLYIDIFPLIPAQKANTWVYFLFHIISVINYLLQVKAGWTQWIPYKRLTARIGYRLLSCFPPIYLKRFRRLLIQLISDPRCDQGTLCSPGGAYQAEKEFYPVEWFEETEKMKFEGRYFDVPIGWEPYLQRNYGNYMELPPPEERKSNHR